MELMQLECWAVVEERQRPNSCRSCISHSAAVSIAVRKLEQDIGTILLDRSTAGITAD